MILNKHQIKLFSKGNDALLNVINFAFTIAFIVEVALGEDCGDLLDSDEGGEVLDIIHSHQVVDELGHLARMSVIESEVAEAVVDVALHVRVERRRLNIVAGQTSRLEH